MKKKKVSKPKATLYTYVTDRNKDWLEAETKRQKLRSVSALIDKMISASVKGDFFFSVKAKKKVRKPDYVCTVCGSSEKSN